MITIAYKRDNTTHAPIETVTTMSVGFTSARIRVTTRLLLTFLYSIIQFLSSQKKSSKDKKKLEKSIYKI